jgi:hypothetical protein
VAIVTLVLWLVTAAAGISLLRAGSAAAYAEAEDQVAEVRSAAAATVPAGRVPAGRSPAIPLTPEGLPPPVPHVRVTARPGQHPLLEFAHPALGVTGMACWFMFTFVHYRPLAWISFCILVVTIGVGLGWFVRNVREVSDHVVGASHFPPRLIALHGGIAALSITLTVLTALVASHG